MSTLLPCAGAGLDDASSGSAGAADSAGVSGVESGDSAGEGAAASPPLWQPGIKRSSVAASTRDRNFFIWVVSSCWVRRRACARRVVWSGWPSGFGFLDSL